MTNTIRCDIVSAEEEIFSGDVRLITATGSLGELGIMPGHTPLITGIEPGTIVVHLENGEEESFYAAGGYLEVQPGIVTILADKALRAKDIDEAAAAEARDQAERNLSDQASDFDFSSAQANLAEAAAQIRTIRRMREQQIRK